MTDGFFIKRCLQLAEKAKGNVAPNPMVGAVLVHNGTIIGEGWHQQYGENHAEVNCINNVPGKYKYLIPESTMYVSLEPCAHYGKTPPCAERIVKEKIKKVVICNEDPFEKVAGRGIRILEENGIDVKKKVLDAEGKWLNRRFFTFHRHKRPYIILKWAQTSNGFFAPKDKSRLQLSNKHSSQLVHKWRTEEAAIMVGFNTALNDDPQLTSRYYKGKQPLRIALDRNLQLPLTHHLYNNAAPTWIINEQKEAQMLSVRFVKKRFNEELLTALLAELYDANIQSLIVEGGTQLLESFIWKNLWDEARIFRADVDIPDGLKAPSLTNAKHVYKTAISSDDVDVYLHTDNVYHYVEGMSL